MDQDNKCCAVEACWISVILRLAIGLLFAAAAVGKFAGGLDGVVAFFTATFENTWLPMPLVLIHAKIVAYIEALIAVWLLLGICLRWGWIFTGLFTVSLAFGMVVAGKYDVAADNYFYVFLCCVGLYVSPFDKLHLGKKSA